MAVSRVNQGPDVLRKAAASESHADTLAVVYEDFDLSAGLPPLTPGENLLAVHGLNILPTSSDFLIAVELLAELKS